MKNKLVFLVVSIFGLTLFVTPNMVSAKTETTDLKETVKEEIELFKSADGYEDYVKHIGNKITSPLAAPMALGVVFAFIKLKVEYLRYQKGYTRTKNRK